MLIKAQKRKATTSTNFQNQSAARFEQPEQSMAPLQEVQISEQVQAPVIQIDRAEIQKVVEIEKQIILQQFETEVAEKRRIVETEIQRKLEEIEINLANIQKREHEIEAILSTEKQNLEIEKAAEQERIQVIEQQLQSQFETAIQQGFEQGYQEAKTNLDKVSTEFEEIIHNIHRSKEVLLLEIEPQITSIALEVARKILQRESKLDSNLILEQVKSAIKKVTIRGGLLEVSINPDDAQHKVEIETALDKMLDKEVRLIFKEDPNVMQGSCIIDTQGGQLNANFKIQIESVKLAFEKYFGKEIILIEAPDEEEIPLELEAVAELEEIALELEPVAELEEIPLELEAITELEEIPLELEPVTEPEEIPLELEAITELEEIPLVLEAVTELEETNFTENLDNQFIFESAVDAQSQQNSNEAFSADALALMSELDSAFNQKNTNNSTDEYVDLDTLDAELESVLSEEVNHVETEIKDDIEIKDHNEIKNPSKIEDINSEDLQALFAADSEEEAITEHPDNQLIFESITSTLNQNHISNSTDEHINIETLDAELESVLGEKVNHIEIKIEDVNHVEIETEDLSHIENTEIEDCEQSPEDLSKSTSSSEIKDDTEIKDDIEIKDHNEIKNPSKIEDINLEDLQALFAADSEETVDEETNADLDFILDQLKENTPIGLENDGSNESKVIEETDELDKIMDKSDLDKIDLNFDLESPNEEDLEALEESMDALLTEVEGEDTDELEALLGASSIKFNFSEEDEDELPEIVTGELEEDDDDKELPEIVIDEIEEDDEVITAITDEEEIDFSENPKKDPVFEEFDEAYDDDYSEGSDPRFPDY